MGSRLQTLIFASETKASATKKQTRRRCGEGARRVQGGCREGAGRVQGGCEEGARRVQGGGEYGSKGKWKSASAPRDHQEEDLKEDIIRSNTLWAIGPANLMKH